MVGFEERYVERWIDAHGGWKLKPVSDIIDDLDNRKWSDVARCEFVDGCSTLFSKILSRKKNFVANRELLRASVLICLGRLLLLSLGQMLFCEIKALL